MEDRKFDVFNFLMDYESGELNDEAIIKGFQYLIDSGLAWQLQGMYGRMAKALIDEGHCKSEGN